MASESDQSLQDDDSFIILGSSPGTSIDIDLNDVEEGDLDKSLIEEAMKDVSIEASMAYKAHFKLGHCPSPSSLMVASTMITEDKSIEELQNQFGQIIDENLILKETLKKNNNSLREQFLLLVSCQEDMKTTHMMHEQKFVDTRMLVEQLRDENRSLRHQLGRCSVSEPHSMSRFHYEPGTRRRASVSGLVTSQCGLVTAPREFDTSPLEFVTSPDDDTINKLTAQLELVERQRRQVIIENEKLKWQKDSLEFMIDAMKIETDDLKAKLKLKNVQEKLSNKETDYLLQIEKGEKQIKHLESLQNMSKQLSTSLSRELEKKDTIVEELETKVTTLQNDLKTAKEKISDLEARLLQLSSKEDDYLLQIKSLETIKEHMVGLEDRFQQYSHSKKLSEELEKKDAIVNKLSIEVATLQSDLKMAQQKIIQLENDKFEFLNESGASSKQIKSYERQIQNLFKKLKVAQTITFEPLRVSLPQESESELESTQYGEFASKVKLYDQTLKHMAELLNQLMQGLSDGLLKISCIDPNDYKSNDDATCQLKHLLFLMRKELEMQHSRAQENIVQVKGVLSIFEGIFKDYSELLKKISTNSEVQQQCSGANMEALTSALVARGQELQALDLELQLLRGDKSDVELLKAQLDLYKSDFEAERESRQKMASDKENVLVDLRIMQRRNQELTMQLEEVRKLNPQLYRTVTSKRPIAPLGPGTSHNATGNATGNTMFTCPKCMRFSCEQYKVLEDHFDFCLDDF